MTQPADSGPVPDDDGEPDELVRSAETNPSSVDLESILRSLSGDADDRRRGATALEAVARGAPGHLGSHVDDLAGIVRSGPPDSRRAVLAAVRDAGRQRPGDLAGLVDPLRERLGDQSPDDAKLTGSALVALLDASSGELSAAIRDLAGRLGDDETAVYALVPLGTTAPGAVVEALESHLSGTDRTTVQRALQVLASISEVDPGAGADLVPGIEAHLADGDPRTVRFAAEVLGNVATEDPTAVTHAVERVGDLLDAGEAATRREAAGIACSLARADPDVVEPIVPKLVERLSDPDRIVRRDACYALGVVRAEDAREGIEAIEADGSPELSAVAARALARLDGEREDPPLPEIPPGEVFRHRSEDPEMTPERRERIRDRRLRDREDGPE